MSLPTWMVLWFHCRLTSWPSIDTWKPTPSPDFPRLFTAPTFTSVIVPHYEITRFRANITIMSPSTTIYIISPASFNIDLDITEEPVTPVSIDSTASEWPSHYLYHWPVSVQMIVREKGGVIGSFLTSCSQAKHPYALLNQDEVVGHAPPLSCHQSSTTQERPTVPLLLQSCNPAVGISHVFLYRVPKVWHFQSSQKLLHLVP